MCHPRFIFVLLMAGLILNLGLSLAGCVKQPEPASPPPDLFWPNPPEVRRIQFINAVSKPSDMNIRPGVFTQFVRYMVGGSAASIVSPYGMASDSLGRIYVADTFLKQVHVFDAAENNYFSFPADRSLLASPVGITVDQNDLIYVTDTQRGVVEIFTDQGKKYLSALGRDVFKRPTGIAVNPKTSELLVVDTLQSKVFRYDLTTRKQKGVFGGSGTAPGRLHSPTNIFVTPDGNIIVSDSLNFRIQVFSPAGKYLSKFGQMGHEPGTFSRPKGVAADSDGNIYVVDALFDNIQVFDASGRLLMAFGDHGKGFGQFWLPTGIYIDADDFIYVADASNRRVQVFKYLKEDIVK